ncbi:MAG: hypothetical protein JWN79_1171 [Gemmatimonadetes bacterium]|jgi:hypothetical protein|nr:hypothetical protein [Gemmatimonadota bacterium]
MRRALSVALATALVLALTPDALAAQQAQLDVHGNFAVGTTTHLHSWGAGAGAQVTFGSTSDPIQLSLSPSLDFLKQEGGSRQTSLSADLDIQPGGGKTVTPYAGISTGANWISGSSGTHAGYETLAGAQVKLSTALTAKAEERFGYVSGQEHSLTTRVGVLLSF